MSELIRPTFYVRHPDDTYSLADTIALQRKADMADEMAKSLEEILGFDLKDEDHGYGEESYWTQGDLLKEEIEKARTTLKRYREEYQDNK